MRIEVENRALVGVDDDGCASLAPHGLAAPLHVLACGFAAIRMQHQWGAGVGAKDALGQHQAYKSDYKHHSHNGDGTGPAHFGNRYVEKPCAWDIISR